MGQDVRRSRKSLYIKSSSERLSPGDLYSRGENELKNLKRPVLVEHTILYSAGCQPLLLLSASRERK